MWQKRTTLLKCHQRVNSWRNHPSRPNSKKVVSDSPTLAEYYGARERYLYFHQKYAPASRNLKLTVLIRIQIQLEVQKQCNSRCWNLQKFQWILISNQFASMYICTSLFFFIDIFSIRTIKSKKYRFYFFFQFRVYPIKWGIFLKLHHLYKLFSHVSRNLDTSGSSQKSTDWILFRNQ